MVSLYRQRLVADPSDIPARSSLAWCLLFQSLEVNCTQAYWNQLLTTCDQLDRNSREKVLNLCPQRPRAASNAHDLIKESLLQATTVSHLSANSCDHDNLLRIQQLVSLIGGDEVIDEAEKEATKILTRMTRAIYARRKGSGRASRMLRTSLSGVE